MGIIILVKNEDFIAVDKSPGISVHNVEDSQNLLQLMEHELQLSKLYPVHRLDKETSGVQILALNERAAKRLADEFQKSSVRKAYVGILRAQLKEATGTWTQALSDKAEGRKNPAGLAKDRVNCETRFQVVETSKFFSKCEFDLRTGRQHQIRKHAALTNHAIVGDPRYGDQKYNQKIADIYKIERMFLHCHRIEILDQIIESPIPPSFADLLKT